jgi:hypothetical protein
VHPKEREFLNFNGKFSKFLKVQNLNKNCPLFFYKHGCFRKMDLILPILDAPLNILKLAYEAIICVLIIMERIRNNNNKNRGSLINYLKL